MSSNNTLSLSLYEDNIRFYFVNVEDGILSSDMEDAHNKLLESVVKDNVLVIDEADCLEIIAQNDKKNIFIFKSFSGETFEAAMQYKSPIVGPRCVHSCLNDNVTIPNNGSPIYTLAMRDVVICTSGLDVAEKRKLERLVGFMGGWYTNNLAEKVTHLVTENIFTKKYESATTHNIKVMRPGWVMDVWVSSRSDNILATNEKFNRHILPPFFNKRFTSTGLSLPVKAEIKELIEKNGGTYSGSFSSRNIDILIMEAAHLGSEKHKAAEKNNIDCLTPEWIRQSAKKGFALPSDAYKIVSPGNLLTSTPEKLDKRNEQFELTNASVLSRIGAEIDVSINETLQSNASAGSPARGSCKQHAATVDAPYKDAINKLNIQAAKRAGLFLDGCNIYVCGFTVEEKDKIVKILNNSGATRYDTIHANITHIIVGAPNKKELSLISATQTSAPLLTLNWLLECIDQKQACTDIEKFAYRMKANKSTDLDGRDAPSPASKKNILSMSSSNDTFKAPRKRLAFNESENNPNASNGANDVSDVMEELMLDQYLTVQSHANVKVTSPPPKPDAAEKGAMLPPSAPPAPAVVKTTSATTVTTSNDSDPKLFESQMSSSELTQNLDFLDNMSVCIVGFDAESYEHLAYYCQKAGAEIVDNTDRDVDYLIASVDKITLDDVLVRATNVVNYNWLIASKKVNRILDIVDYFKPIIFPEDLKPLEGMVIVFSSYPGDDRTFLVCLVECMGAVVHDTYKRAVRPLLICPPTSTDNPKFVAGLKWNLPIVSRDWALECYRLKKRVPLRKFLIGNSVAPADDISDEPTELDISMSHTEEDLAPIATTSSNSNTPVLRHKRVAALQENRPNSAEKRSPDELIDKPWPPLAEMAETLNWDTPTREHYQKIVSEDNEMMQNETPNTKRRRLEEFSKIGTPELREYVSTPYQEKLRQAERDEGRRLAEERRALLMQESTKKSMPWSEFKRKFWREALGDQYESPSQSNMANTQALQNSYMETSTVSQTPAREAKSDSNMKKLNDLISRRNIITEINRIDSEPLPDTMPPYSAETEFPNTNLEVGWLDPTEQTPAPLNAMKFRGTPTFALASNTNIANITTMIQQLNGIVCTDKEKAELKYTHYICEAPNRGQSTFACIVAGKWLLTPKYVIESANAGYFLDEELFEWGNPKAYLDKTDNPMAKTAYRWRLKLQTNPHEIPTAGAFHGFNVILPFNTKHEQLRALITAGSGCVVNATEPYHKCSAISIATHYISNKMTLSPQDIRAFEKHNIICVNMMYLNEFIVSEQPPDITNFLPK